MKVIVTAMSYRLDDLKGKLHLKIETDKLFTAENKTELINRICRLIETEMENHEFLKEKIK